MQIAIGLYPEFTALDAIGPYQVLTQVPRVPSLTLSRITVWAHHHGAHFTRTITSSYPFDLASRNSKNSPAA